MTIRPYLDLDLSNARRVLVAGDIHGHLSHLTDALSKIEYDASAGDRLILLGDLFDRGPDVITIYDWLEANPNVIACLGNHCDMLLGTIFASHRDDFANAYNLFRNGGAWLTQFAPGYTPEGAAKLMVDLLDASEPHAMLDRAILNVGTRLLNHPIAIRAITPGGRDVGFLHADIADGSWQDLVDRITHADPATRRKGIIDAIWSRDRFDALKRAARHDALPDFECTVPGIDHVFFGHSITAVPIKHGNCSWIDTGAYKTGRVTVVDVDDWLA